MSDRPDQIKALFLEAMEEHAPARWPAFLDQACAGDAALRAEVEHLLRARSELGSFHETPGPTLAATIDPPVHEAAGTVIGLYKLLQPIGEGGMGTVWMAEQTQPMQRKVALKIIKAGMDTRQVIARFEAERQALALMEHPNIAKVLDAGATNTGRPFFVMELVKGQSLTRYCNEHRLTLRQRLDLFLSVCQAIQHAHTKGIIHRDVKPSNVLVAPYDCTPVVKVIDFGIAKATGQRLTEKTLFTEFGAVIGTLEYMSPEQAELNNQDIDIRSDVYSLGVLLYELLTGTTPLDRGRLKQAAFTDILRMIREEEPPIPSTRLAESKDTLPSISAQRHTEPVKLTKLVRGELDWIVMKALEKDRNRRYETANGFAMDVRRYLDDEPVLACPPSMRYRLRKFARRNKGPVLAVGVIVFLLVAAIVGTTTGLVRALAAEQRAVTERDEKGKAWRQTRQALNTMTDEVVDDLLGRQVQLTDQHREFLKQVLAHHAAFAAARADDPEGRQSQAEGYFRVGGIRYRLGEFKEAEAAFRAGLVLDEQLAADFPNRPDFRHDQAASLGSLGNLLRDTGRPKEAEAAYGDALLLFQQLAADFPDRPDFRQSVATTHNNLGLLLSTTNRPKEAESAYRDAVTLLKQLVIDFPKLPHFRRDLALGHLNLGVLFTMDQPKAAESAYHDALTLLKQLVAEFPNRPDFRQDLAKSHNDLGGLLQTTGRPKEAESAFHSALITFQQLAADFPNRPDYRQGLAQTHNNRGILLRATGWPKEAGASYRDALAIGKQLTADFPNRPDYQQGLAESYYNQGNLLSDTGQLKEAESAYRAALALLKQPGGKLPNRPEVRYGLAESFRDLGKVLSTTNRPEEAAEACREALTLFKQLVADFPNHPDYRYGLAKSFLDLGKILYTGKELKEAEAAFREARVLFQQLAADFPDRPNFRHHLALSHFNRGVLLQGMSRLKEAELAYGDALALQKQLVLDLPTQPAYRQNLASITNNLSVLLRVTGRTGEAEAAYHKALALRKQLAADFPDRADFRQELAASHFNLGNLLHGTNRLKEAEAAWRDSLVVRKKLTADFPDRADFRGELETSLTNLGSLAKSHLKRGNVLFNAGRAKEAEVPYRDALALLKQLAADFPDRPDFRYDLAQCHNNVANVLYTTDRPKEAEAAYRDGLVLFTQLAADFPKRADFRQDLGGSHYNLGVLLHKTGRPREAEEAYRAALAIGQKLATDFPEVADYQNDLASILVNLAILHNQRREFTTAGPLLEQGRVHLQAALKPSPKNPAYRQSYANILAALAQNHLALGDHVRAATTADDLARFGHDPRMDTYNAACFLCQCATLAEKDAKLTEGRRKELAQGYADRALALLRQTVAHGFKDVAHMKKDADLQPLRARQDFQKLLAGLEGKTKE